MLIILMAKSAIYKKAYKNIAKLAVVHFDMSIVHSGIILVQCGTRGRSVLGIYI
jgi:hypothetical protein